MLTIVTSLSKGLWDSYARDSVASWVKHLKGDYSLCITVDGPIPSDIRAVAPNAAVISLDGIPVFREYLENFGHIAMVPNGAPPGEHFRWDHTRFWPKVVSMEYVTPDEDSDGPCLWLDADVYMHKDLEIERIIKDLYHGRNPVTDPPWSVVCLDRAAPWGYMDSGYFLWSNPDPVFRLYNIYRTGSIFMYKEHHDAWLMNRVLETFGPEWLSENVFSLSGKKNSKDPREFLNPMEHTWLSGYLTHFKGQRKQEIR